MDIIHRTQSRIQIMRIRYRRSRQNDAGGYRWQRVHRILHQGGPTATQIQLLQYREHMFTIDQYHRRLRRVMRFQRTGRTRRGLVR
ncbi:hypothetical protein D3C81_2205050 [compost metagenome]